MTTLAGVLIEHRAEKRFVDARAAQRVVRPVAISMVPGTSLGMTFLGGRVISVVELGPAREELGPAREELLVCELHGELVAFAGLHVLAAGFFEVAGDGVLFGSEIVAPLDLIAELGSWEQGFWKRFHQGEPE
jgi:hypothetical protein